MAAWEFGAGRMPHWGARLFCLPLVLIGFLWSPRRIWTSFSAGRRSHSLHVVGVDQHLLESPWETIRDQIASKAPRESERLAVLRFIAIVVEAMVVMAAPSIAAVALAGVIS